MRDTPDAESVRRIARAAGARLADDLGPTLPLDVARALQPRRRVDRRYDVDPIGLGGLIVSVASLAWTIYTDSRRRAKEPASQTIVHTLEVEFEMTHLDEEQRDLIIRVIEDEVQRELKGGEDAPA